MALIKNRNQTIDCGKLCDCAFAQAIILSILRILQVSNVDIIHIMLEEDYGKEMGVFI